MRNSGSMPPRPLITTPVRRFTTRLPAETAASQSASHAWDNSAKNPSPASDDSVKISSPRLKLYTPMADAEIIVSHCGDLATNSASFAVGPTRESHNACLWASVNRPMIGSPAKCTNTSTPASKSAAGDWGSHRRCRFFGVVRTNWITLCPNVVSWAASARPTSPREPVIATVKGWSENC